ncbi:hypothetical protein LJB87_02255 [Alistipes sp. OttesenSCG-928-L06]|nr:hypothetical protein [Alistipes sp. OttesenSCG-928-L06]
MKGKIFVGIKFSATFAFAKEVLWMPGAKWGYANAVCFAMKGLLKSLDC